MASAHEKKFAEGFNGRLKWGTQERMGYEQFTHRPLSVWCSQL